MSTKPRIFISYSHHDGQHKEELLKRLRIINRKHPAEIDAWHDGKLLAGDKVDPKIRAQLDAADLVCMLISPDFIASDYCYLKEMTQAMENVEQRGTRVVAIIVRETPDWHEYLFGRLLALPDDGKPLEDWPSADKFWGKVQVGLKGVLADHQSMVANAEVDESIHKPDQAENIQSGEQRSAVMPNHMTSKSLLEKPDWASVIDRDHYGIYAEFVYKNIRQCMRWINSGTFMMGSPEDEVERSDNETLHEVTLSQGYWLADTACTQGLWEAVMGANPSKSNQGLLYPVDSVSWEDVQRFIQHFNKQIPGLAVRLPSEAEWEYACRAGTQTPFSFGENIMPEQVNYNGEYPYAEGAKGQNRRKTVEVMALPKNSWGLYQMRGNVWEWCSDWYDTYPVGSITDPAGSASGTDRVLRGGSWIHYGGHVRSAFRHGDRPGRRNDGIGFRLALGQTSR